MKLETRTERASWGAVLGSKLRDYGLLVKLRLSLTVVFSSVMAFLITSPTPSISALLTLSLGGFLVTAASNALNQVLEKDFDRQMKRTADRPIAAGRMSMSEGVMAAGFMSMFGIIFLALFNPWTAFLGMLAMVIYAFVYTPFKRISPIAVTIGAVAGAFPVLIGGVAAEGYISGLGLLLFSIQFCWQYPHFWSIGWLGFEDYQKAGYAFIPANGNVPDGTIGLQAFMFSLVLLLVVSIPFFYGYVSIWTTAIVVGISVVFAWLGYRFYDNQNRKTALQLMLCSLGYIPFVLIAFFLDKLWF